MNHTYGDDFAYPVKNQEFGAQCGLTKREYFAAMAMQGAWEAMN